MRRRVAFPSRAPMNGASAPLTLMNDIQTHSESTPSSRHYDLVIVGAGIVGLATAREFLLRHPELRLLILEKEQTIASHQSGHNSGVIHTGIYYTPGSLKARACVAGHRAMLDFCRERGIPFELCGKLIVALNESELPRLANLYERGVTNGVQDLEVIGPQQLRELEPCAVGIKAIHSPNTGIIDFTKVAEAYAQEVRQYGCEIVTNHEVIALTTGRKQTMLRVQHHTRTNSTQTEIAA